MLAVVDCSATKQCVEADKRAQLLSKAQLSNSTAPTSCSCCNLIASHRAHTATLSYAYML
jgi:hypothetical protein